MFSITVSVAAIALAQLSPQESMELMDHADTLRVDLVVAEPLIIDPVAVAWDEYGRMYVVENRGYPTGPGEGQAPAGMVALITDSDGDGEYDTRTGFAAGLEYPNGVMAWRGGILVTDSPYLLHFKDTDGDGIADVREPVLEGFAPGGSTQLRVSHPTLGLDNWIYMTNGLSGGDIQVTKGDGTIVKMGANDLRYNPRTMDLETIAGRAQFGLAFDDAGNRFICSNRNHVQHVVMEPRDVGRNPYSPYRATVHDIPEHGAAAKLYPISENKTTAYSHIGTFTAACGLVIYRGDAMPNEFYGNAFVCDPTGNLVHRDIVERDGSSFVGLRGEHESEFLRSKDEWFRPVYLTNGPDGALYMCDMYRGTIEHPRYLPADLAARTDFERGKDRGRIYRIAAKDNPPKPIETKSLREDPISAIENSVGWRADTAQRLLLEAEVNAESIRARLDGTESSSARIRYVHLLNALGHLQPEDLAALVSAKDTNVQAAAIALAEQFAGQNAKLDDSIRDQLMKNDPVVALAAFRAIQQWPDAERTDALAHIAEHTPLDSYLRGALYSAAYGHAPAILDALLEDGEYDDAEILRILARECAQDHGPDTAAQRFTPFANRNPELFQTSIDALIAGSLEGLNNRSDVGASPIDALSAALSSAGVDSVKGYADNQKSAWLHAAANGGRKEDIEMLAYLDEAEAAPVLRALLTPQSTEARQRAAIGALAQFSDAAATGAILKPTAWEALTPRAREDAVNALLIRKPRIDALFDAMAAGDVSPRSLTALQRNRLLRSGNTEVKARAEEAFAALNAGRAEALAKFQPAANLDGDPVKGATHYETICSSCHVFQGKGFSVGPELSDIRAKTAETIILHIIEPNREVTSGYETCEVETVDGDTYTGIMTSDDASGITLTQAYGNAATIARENIAAVRNAPLSLMPEGIEEGMTPQDMADLIAFLRRDL